MTGWEKDAIARGDNLYELLWRYGPEADENLSEAGKKLYREQEAKYRKDHPDQLRQGEYFLPKESKDTKKVGHLQKRIDFITSMIRENRIEHARLKKDLKELLSEFETPEGLEC